MLVFNNYDQPGVLRKIAEKLAAAKINIAHFSLGRTAQGKMAMGAVVLDTPAPQELVNSLGKYADITNVMQVCRLKLLIISI